MLQGIEARLAAGLIRWVLAVRQRAGTVLLLSLLATLGCGIYALRSLEYNSDTVAMVGRQVESRQILDEYAALFPNLENALLVVIDGETPELARSAAEGLAEGLEQRSELFEDVYAPGGGSFFETYGLLYASLDELDRFADEIATLQPVIAELERDGSIANLSELVVSGLEAAEESGEGERWSDVLERIGSATMRVYEEFPVAVSWEDLMLEGSALDVATRRVLILHPILDFRDILAAGPPRSAVFEEAEERGFTPERGVTVRLTGNPVLNYEELLGLAWDLGVGGLFCFLLVAAILHRALRSLPMVIAAIVTLLVGLVWTAAWATAAVGHLQIISMSVGILYIGLGVDFAIHLGLAYADALQAGRRGDAAWREAVAAVGPSLVLCAVTTSIGFFVFVPTVYSGVSELGLIAGGGMFVIVLLTFSFFPALLERGLRVDPERHLARPVRFLRSPFRFFEGRERAVRIASLVLALVGVALLPGARFDPNAVRMRDPSTQSVQAFEDLLSETGLASPWYINAVRPDLDSARELAARVAELPMVSQTVTLADYIPDDQAEKIGILSEIALMLEPMPDSGLPAPARPGVNEQVVAMRRLYEALEPDPGRDPPHPLEASMRRLRGQIGDFLERVESDSDPQAALAKLEDVLLASFPEQLARLRRALAVEPIGIDDLPTPLVRRMLHPDGHARVQIFPRETLLEEEDFVEFADGVRELAPRGTGVAVNLLEFGRATQRAFRQALVSAVVLIAILLAVMWRRLADVLLVMGPLTLGAVWIGASMVLLDMPFNYTNVIVIPLLFGIGVDSGIHMVHRSLHVEERASDVLTSTTARAIYYSAVTTTASFGTLAFSGHGGMASLGILLCIGMALTVFANLVVLPAWIGWVVERRRSREGRAA